MTNRSSAEIVLRSDEVHVWTAALERPQQHLGLLEQTLSAEERRRADRFRFERGRRHFVAGRGILRMLLARYVGTEPQALRFRYGDAGKPELVDAPGSAELHFNCSHSHERAVYAVARRRRVGVDIEAVRPLPEADQIARLCFSARENAVLRSLPPDRQREAFFNGWTRKEAYVKAVGNGLTLPLDRIEVSLAPGESSALLSIDGDPETAAKWSLGALSTGFRYAAALAVEGHGQPPAFKHRDFP